MARAPSKPHAAASPSDSDHHSRKRVGKACDRCRLKKSKCNGTSPCLRCQQDNAICVFGERKRAHDKQYPKGYVEMLEGQQQQLVTGLQELYKMAVTGGWSGSPLELSAAGHPLTHDILDRLGLLKHGGDHDGFEEDFEVIQQRLIRGGAALHSHSDDDDALSEHMSDNAPSPLPHKRTKTNQKHRRQQSVQLNSFSSTSSREIDSPATPPTPADLMQTVTMATPEDVAANYNVMRMSRQTWPQQPQLSGISLQPVLQQQQLQQVYGAGDDMDYMYKSPMTFQQPALSMDGMDGVFDGSMLSSLGMQNTLVAPLPDMSLDEFFLQ